MAKRDKQPDKPVIETHLEDHIKNAKYHGEPTRTYEIGEEVIHGNHDHTIILEAHADNRVYRVLDSGTRTSGHKREEYQQECACYWNELFKKGSFKSDSKFSAVEKYDIRFYNTDVYSLLLRGYSGINFNPPYQRELVWDDEQKMLLLESIFSGIDIGKFVFVKLDYHVPEFDWKRGIFYEILDGKQRLTTIMDFYDDRFPYKGVYYSQLSPTDRYAFTGFTIAYGEIDDPKDIKKIYQYFIRLNTFGKPIDQEHISRVKNLYAMCQDKDIFTVKNNPFSLGISVIPIKSTLKAGTYEIISIGKGYNGCIFQNPVSSIWHVAEASSGALIGCHKDKQEAISLVREDVRTGDERVMAEQIEMAIQYNNHPHLETITIDELFTRLARNVR